MTYDLLPLAKKNNAAIISPFSLQGDAYESLPLHLEPLPAETEPPPPPGWVGRSGGAPAAPSNGSDTRGSQAKTTMPGSGSEPSEQHLAWFRRMESSTQQCLGEIVVK